MASRSDDSSSVVLDSGLERIKRATVLSEARGELGGVHVAFDISFACCCVAVDAVLVCRRLFSLVLTLNTFVPTSLGPTPLPPL